MTIYQNNKPYPLLKTYVAFSDGPYVANPTWTEITSYVRHVETNRGRATDWSTFSGQATVVLNNRTRAFDAFNASGPYYGQLTPRRQIKIEATTYTGSAGSGWNEASTYPVFRGYVAGWPEAWTAAGTDSTVTIQCFDALQLLGSSNLTYDWAYTYITTTSPRHYWKLDDPVPGFAVSPLQDYGSVPFPMRTTTSAQNGDQLAVGLANSSVQSTDYCAATYQTAIQQGTAGDFSISFWSIPQTTDSSVSCVYGFFQGWNVLCDFVQTSTTAKWQFTVANASATYQFPASITNLNPGQPHHIALTWTSASHTPHIYIDGIEYTGAVVTTGAIIILDYTESYGLAQGTYQQLVVWNTVVAQAVFQNIVYWSLASFPETTAARMDRLIGQTPFPAALYSKPYPTYVNVLDITDNGPSVASELQLVADTEGAPLYVSKSGVLTMLTRYQQFTQSTSFNSQMQFGSVGAAGLGEDITLTLDGDSMRNRFTVTTSGGGYWTTDYSASETAYGIAGQNVDTQSQDLANAQNLGLLFGGLGQYVYPLFSEMKAVVTNTGNWDSFLGLELLNRVTLVLLVPTGSPIIQDVLLSRIRFVASPGYLEAFIEGSVRFASAFRLDYSSINGPDVILYTG